MDLSQMNLWQIFLAGGPLMWPLLICSIIAAVLVIEKLWYLHTIELDGQVLLTDILTKIKHRQIKEALQACEKKEHPLAYILKAGVLKYDRPRSQIKEAIEDASLYEIPRLEKNLPVLVTIAHLAPLLGFLGTAVGMIVSFQAIQAKGAALHPVSPGDLAAGIWQALLSTVSGLIVAIPAFIAYNYLVSRVNNIILEMEKASTELVNFLTE